MKKLMKGLKVSLLIFLGGMLLPALLSVVASGFQVKVVSIVNYIFFTGILIAMTGGVMMIGGYSRLKKKVLRNSNDGEIEQEKHDDKVSWADILFYTGIVIVLGAVGIGEIF